MRENQPGSRKTSDKPILNMERTLIRALAKCVIEWEGARDKEAGVGDRSSQQSRG